MSAKRLTLALALLFATPALAQADPVATAAARMKAFPVAQSIERADAYTPAETVKGRPRALALARDMGGIDPAALAAAQAYADAQNSFAFVVFRDVRSSTNVMRQALRRPRVSVRRRWQRRLRRSLSVRRASRSTHGSTAG